MRALVPEDLNGRAEQRSLHRAITAKALGVVRRTSPISILSQSWPHDTQAERALAVLSRGAVTPTSSTNATALATQAVRMLGRLAPSSAALQLFAVALNVDMNNGIATCSIPNVASVPPAKFVGETQAAPLVQFVSATATLGPVKKVVLMSATTNELETASPESASQIIGRLLAVSAEKGIDLVAFGDDAASDEAPAGLLHGATPIAPTPGGGSAAMIADVANLAGAIGDAGLNPTGMMIVASPRQAITLALTAGPRFTIPILSAAALADKTIAAFMPDAIGVMVESPPSIDVSREVSVHYESVSPVADALASATRSAFQQDLTVIRCAARLAWTLAAAGGAAVVNATTW